MSRPAFFDRKLNYDMSLQKDDDFEDPNADLQGFVDEPEIKYHGAGSVDEGLEKLFGHMGSSSRGPRIAKCLFILLVCFAVIAVVVGVGISVIDGDESNGTEHGLRVSIPSVPVDLHVICAPMNLRSEEGYSNCLELCEPAECCELPPDSENSCAEEHRHQCELYRSSCQHLDHLKPEDDNNEFVTPEDKSSPDLSHSDDESTHNESIPETPGDSTMSEDVDLFDGDETNNPDTDLPQENSVSSEDEDLDLFDGDETNGPDTDLPEEDSVGSEDFNLNMFDGDETNGPETDLLEEGSVSSEDFGLDLFGEDELNDQVTRSQDDQSNEDVDTDFDTLDLYSRNEVSETDQSNSQTEEIDFEDIDLYGTDRS